MIPNISLKDKKMIADKMMKTFLYNGIPVTSCPFVIPEEFFAGRGRSDDMKLQVFIQGVCDYTKAPYPMVPVEIPVSSEQEAEERATIIAQKGIRVKSSEVHFYDKKKSGFVVYPAHRISEVRLLEDEEGK